MIVPDVRGLLESDAGREIEGAGLSVGQITREFSESVETSRVIKQDPSAGEMALLDNSVSFEISRGPRGALATTCPSQMIQYFKFEELSPNFVDELGGSSATCSRCPTSVQGRVGRAQSFDGRDDGVNVADNGQFDWSLQDEFTIEYWMRSDSAACTRVEVIVGRRGARPSEFQMWTGLRCGSNMKQPLRFFLLDNAGSRGGNNIWPDLGPDRNEIFPDVPREGVDLTDGNWHHIAAVRTLTQIHLYFDGINKLSVEKEDYIRDFAATTELNIGWLDGFENEFRYDGIIDELALYKRALTEEEILQHFSNGLNGLGYCEAGDGMAQPQ
ncbi:MAG: PASTA domain-containing protein [Gammaproteobacteria bacterium]|nr:PASTA domain-containing protein [Gammaproteobacteria bacterium]